MKKEEAREIHCLLFSFLGIFHEKFVVDFRRQCDFKPRLKKNHAKIIHLLYQNDSLTSTELGKMLDIEKGSLTTIIDQLEEMELITRSPAPNDRRKILLSLSSSGKEYMENVIERFTRNLMDLFQNIDNRETDQFIASLKHVVEFMQKL